MTGLLHDKFVVISIQMLGEVVLVTSYRVIHSFRVPPPVWLALALVLASFMSAGKHFDCGITIYPGGLGYQAQQNPMLQLLGRYISIPMAFAAALRLLALSAARLILRLP